MKVKSEREVAQSCPTLSDPMDCSILGSSIHGICQARVLEWGAIAMQETPVRFLGQEDPLERNRVEKSWIRLSNFHFHDPLLADLDYVNCQQSII